MILQNCALQIDAENRILHPNTTKVPPCGRARGEADASRHGCTMLKRQGVHLRPLPKRRCPEGRQTSAAERQLAASVTAWRVETNGSTEQDSAALEHLKLAGYRPHRTCQICQQGLRARLQRRSLRARQAAPEEDTHTAPDPVGVGGVQTPQPAALLPATSTPAFAPADSSVWSPRSPRSASPINTTTSSDATLPGGAPRRTYWADVGRAAWEAYWDLQSGTASTTSRDSGRVPDEFLDTAWAISGRS